MVSVCRRAHHHHLVLERSLLANHCLWLEPLSRLTVCRSATVEVVDDLQEAENRSATTVIASTQSKLSNRLRTQGRTLKPSTFTNHQEDEVNCQVPRRELPRS